MRRLQVFMFLFQSFTDHSVQENRRILNPKLGIDARKTLLIPLRVGNQVWTLP